MTHLEEPLQRFPVVRTSDTEEMKHALFTAYGATGFDVPDPDGFEGCGNYVQLEDIALGFCAYGAPTKVNFPEGDFVRQQIGLSGHAATTIDGATTEIHARQSCITSPERSATLQFGRNYKQLILRVDKTALERKLSLILGGDADRKN